MAFDYSGIVGTASDLINKFGKTTANLRTKGAATTDPVAGTVSYAASTDTPINAVQIEHNERLVPGAVIEDDDLFWVLDTLPGLEDDIEINGTVHNIVQMWPVTPGGTFVACRIQTRGGVIDASAGTPGTAPSGAFDYSGIAATASDLIGEFGKPSINLRSIPSVTSDSVAGTVSFPSSTSTPIEGVEISHNERYMPGALIETGDKFFALDTLAGIGDELEIGALQFNVIRVWPVKPGDTFIACRVQTQGGIQIAFDNVINGTDNVINSGDNVVTQRG